MTTLVDVMLEVARIVDLVREGTATDGSTTQLTDSNIDEPNDSYRGGTLWLLSGDNDGACEVIKSHGEGGVLTLKNTLSNAIAAGVSYAVAGRKFPKHVLKQAVQMVLRETDIMGKDETLEVTADTQVYTLPTGVYDVRRVEVQTNESEPYDYRINQHWREQNGSIYFDPTFEPITAGMTIRLWYAKPHGEIAESGSIDNALDIQYLKWAAAVQVLRRKIQEIKRDNPTDIDMLNEAKSLEESARNRMSKYSIRLMNRDAHLARW